MTHYSRGIQDQRLYKDLFNAISKDCILLTGCGLLIHARTDGGKSPPTIWDEMLGKIIDWCELRIPIGDEKSVADREKLKSIRDLVTSKNLVKAEQEIDGYISDKVRLQQCLRSILLYDQAKISRIYQLIVTIPFCAYLTTCYDTFIDDAYFSVHGHRLNTFTETSIQVAIEEYREKRPFILKLHGDIDNPTSIILTDRDFKERLKSTNAYIDGLKILISRASFLIAGFEKADSEVRYIEDLLHASRDSATSSKNWIVVPKEQRDDLKENEEISIIQYAYDEKHTGLIRFFENLESSYKEKGIIDKNLEIKEEKKQRKSKSTYTTQQVNSTEIFISYAHVEKDKNILKALLTRLSPLERDNNTTIWSASQAQLGTDEKHEIQTHLHAANVILLLVSPDYIKKMYEDFQIQQIMGRNKAQGIPVIPIIIRATPDLMHAPFSGLTSLPRNNKAVTSWPNQDEAYEEIVTEIRDTLTRQREAKVNSRLWLITPSDSSPDEVS